MGCNCNKRRRTTPATPAPAPTPPSADVGSGPAKFELTASGGQPTTFARRLDAEAARVRTGGTLRRI